MPEESVALAELEALREMGSFVWDVHRDRVSWSDGLLHLHGIAAQSETSLAAMLARVHPDDRVRCEQAMMDALVRRGTFRQVARIVRADGEVRVLERCGGVRTNAQGAATHLFGTCRDITEEVRARAALEENERRLRMFVEHASDALFVHDQDDDGRIVDVNARACESLGMTRDELIGLSPHDVDPDVQPAALASMMDALASQRSLLFESRHRRKDGSTFPVLVRLSPFQAGERRLSFVLATDITERRALEDRLRTAQRLEAIGRLAGGVAHQFNNLLTVIRASCANLLEDIDERHPNYEALHDIDDAGRLAAELTRQLLAFSRRALVAPKLTNVNASIERHAAALARVLGPRITLQMELDRNLACIDADRGQLEQVLTNLAANARDAMPQGGVFQLSSRMVMVAPPFSPWEGSAPRSMVELRARDTGHGMDELTRSVAFEPFFTTKEVGRGTGLGLAVVHGIVEQSGGEAHIESAPGSGTTVILRFPSVVGEAAQDSTHPPFAARQRRATIVIVDDEPALRRIAQAALVNEGYRVIGCENGREALSRVRELPEPPDLVITDLTMPEMDGRELAAQLWLVHPSQRVLFASGYARDSVLRTGDPRRPHGFLAKPFTPRELVQEVARMLDARARSEL